MEQRIKEIIAIFIKTPVENILPDTPIDRSALKSSIMLHRFYARLASEGITVDNYWDIKTVGELLQATGPATDRHNSAEGGILSVEPFPDSPVTETATPFGDGFFVSAGGNGLPVGEDFSTVSGLGIDMEEIASMPVVGDFREDDFYTMNFAPQEIAYCILRPDPYASFAGLFAAKESMAKAKDSYRKKPFNGIVIHHSPEGRPYHQGFRLSISHTREMAIAIAAADDGESRPAVTAEQAVSVPGGISGISVWMVIVSLLLSVLAIILVLIR